MAFGIKKNEAAKDVTGAVDTSINAFLGAGTSFEGRLEFTGTAQISGAFKGEVVSQGVLSVGQGGEVEGNFTVGQLNVSGNLKGSATCTRKAVILRSAIYDGELKTPKLEMEDGARFEGRISMPSE